MRAGELTESITIQRQQISKDANSSMVSQWVDVIKLRATYAPKSGLRQEENLETFGTLKAAFYVQLTPGIRATDRIKYGNSYYLIQGEPLHLRRDNMTILNAELSRSIN